MHSDNMHHYDPVHHAACLRCVSTCKVNAGNVGPGAASTLQTAPSLSHVVSQDTSSSFRHLQAWITASEASPLFFTAIEHYSLQSVVVLVQLIAFTSTFHFINGGSQLQQLQSRIPMQTYRRLSARYSLHPASYGSLLTPAQTPPQVIPCSATKSRLLLPTQLRSQIRIWRQS